MQDPNHYGSLILFMYFYHFLSLTCGSIGHHNIWGWAAEYPQYENLVEFFKKNAFGERVLDHVSLSEWHTDARRTVMEIEKEINTPLHVNWSALLKAPAVH